MADGTAAATLEPIEDEGVLVLMRRVLGDYHDSLAGAEFRLFWTLDRPLTSWGSIQVATELMWWLGEVDVVLKLNKRLWEACTEKGRLFLLDHFLSLCRGKTSGNLEMETTRGTRTLFEGLGYSLVVSPQVMARNPEGLLEIAEVKELQKALSEPEQFLLELESAAGEQRDVAA